MLDYRKRGRVVEGSSLENCRRCEPFVSSNLTASAKNKFQKVPESPKARISHYEDAGFFVP